MRESKSDLGFYYFLDLGYFVYMNVFACIYMHMIYMYQVQAWCPSMWVLDIKPGSFVRTSALNP